MKTKIKKNIPNIITFSRVVALVSGFIYFIKDEYIVAMIFYLYGVTSDAIDGYLARKLDAYSKFGKYLDAISDKFLLLSIIIVSIINKNYLVILPAIFELIISIIAYLIIIKKRKSYTERVGKIKTTIEFTMMIVALLLIRIKIMYIIFIPLLILTIYFQVQCINAYINQLNSKTKEIIVDFKGKKTKEKIRLLLEEFKYYLLNPVKIIK